MTPTPSQDPPIPQGGGGLMLWPWPWQGGWGGDPGPGTYMGVSKNRATPKSSILIRLSIINHPIWGTPIFDYFWKHPYLVSACFIVSWKDNVREFVTKKHMTHGITPVMAFFLTTHKSSFHVQSKGCDWLSSKPGSGDLAFNQLGWLTSTKVFCNKRNANKIIYLYLLYTCTDGLKWMWSFSHQLLEIGRHSFGTVLEHANWPLKSYLGYLASFSGPIMEVDGRWFSFSKGDFQVPSVNFLGCKPATIFTGQIIYYNPYKPECFRDFAGDSLKNHHHFRWFWWFLVAIICPDFWGPGSPPSPGQRRFAPSVGEHWIWPWSWQRP